MRALIPLIAGISLAACAHDKQPSMTFDQCGQAHVCHVEGFATVEFAEPALLARLALADGRCVDVSLPMTTIHAIGRRPRMMRVIGSVLPALETNDPFTQIKVNGRLIGRGACGDFLVFVD